MSAAIVSVERDQNHGHLEAMRELAEARRAHAEGDYVTGDELRSRFTRG